MLPLAWLFLIVAEEGLAVLVFVNVACIRECCGFMDSTLAGSSRTHCARCPALSAFCRMNRRSFSPELREGVQEPLAHTTSFFVYEVRFMHRSRRQGQINPTTQAHTHAHLQHHRRQWLLGLLRVLSIAVIANVELQALWDCSC